MYSYNTKRYPCHPWEYISVLLKSRKNLYFSVLNFDSWVKSYLFYVLASKQKNVFMSALI